MTRRRATRRSTGTGSSASSAVFVVVAGVLVAVLAIALVTCRGDAEVVATTTTSVTSTTIPETTTSTASTTTTSTSSTSSTSSTLAPVEGLDMSAEGLGEAIFGADADTVIDYVRRILGSPTTDTGWNDPFDVGAACPGTEVRFVAWNDLELFFSDESTIASGRRHFASYTYGPADGPQLLPPGIMTTDGITVGVTVEMLRTMYPRGVVYPGDELFDAAFTIVPGLTAFLTDEEPQGVATSFLGGFGCGG